MIHLFGYKKEGGSLHLLLNGFRTIGYMIRSVYKKILQNGFVWSVIKYFGRFLDSFHNYKNELFIDLRKRSSHHLEVNIFQNKTVLYGPFTGLKYPSFSSIYSVIYPKLLGSYEEVLHPSLEEAIEYNYPRIVDIGCAEGYYAVGMALKSPSSNVVCYDLDKKAIELCREMAFLNDVEKNIKFEGEFTEADLQIFNSYVETLIICDCEGFEYDLFQEKNIKYFRNCDLIVELHDFINPEISKSLKNSFYHTHFIEVLNQTIPIKKKYPILQKLNGHQRDLIINEYRPVKMQWMILKRKN